MFTFIFDGMVDVRTKIRVLKSNLYLFENKIALTVIDFDKERQSSLKINYDNATKLLSFFLFISTICVRLPTSSYRIIGLFLKLA